MNLGVERMAKRARKDDCEARVTEEGAKAATLAAEDNTANMVIPLNFILSYSSKNNFLYIFPQIRPRLFRLGTFGEVAF
jgi:hypothetical protein